MPGDFPARLIALFKALPDLFVEVEADRVAQRLDRRHQAAHRHTACQGVGHGEGDAEVHEGEGHGLEHGTPR
ncbi:hypothetical protein D3C81_1808720 [compost metagenome]